MLSFIFYSCLFRLCPTSWTQTVRPWFHKFFFWKWWKLSGLHTIPFGHAHFWGGKNLYQAKQRSIYGLETFSSDDAHTSKSFTRKPTILAHSRPKRRSLWVVGNRIQWISTSRCNIVSKLRKAIDFLLVYSCDKLDTYRRIEESFMDFAPLINLLFVVYFW